jgi:hypothetical protein
MGTREELVTAVLKAGVYAKEGPRGRARIRTLRPCRSIEQDLHVPDQAADVGKQQVMADMQAVVRRLKIVSEGQEATAFAGRLRPGVSHRKRAAR